MISKDYVSLPRASVNAILPASDTVLAAIATGAAGAAVTLTLVAPGAGLFQYIYAVEIERHCSLALAVAVGLSDVTSTNLGGLVWSFGLPVMLLGESQKQTSQFGGVGVRVAAANTATTIVCPAQANSQWRVRVVYRIAA